MQYFVTVRIKRAYHYVQAMHYSHEYYYILLRKRMYLQTVNMPRQIKRSQQRNTITAILEKDSEREILRKFLKK
jgi:hypothetical protein